MTQNTMFKEFVEERGLNFSLLDFNSPEHKELVATFNKAKLALIEEGVAREHEDRARMVLEEQQRASAAEELHTRRGRPAKKSDSFSAQP